MGIYVPDYTQAIITTQILEDLYICVIHLVNNAILLQYVRMYEYIRYE